MISACKRGTARHAPALCIASASRRIMMAQIDPKPGFRRPATARRPRAIKRNMVQRDERPRMTEDEKLDEALIESFPASDPAVSTPRKS
jgi:hypothetical protein